MRSVGITFVAAVALLGAMCVAETPKIQTIDDEIAAHEAAIQGLKAAQRRMREEAEKEQFVSLWALRKILTDIHTKDYAEEVCGRLVPLALKLDTESGNEVIINTCNSADMIICDFLCDLLSPPTTEWTDVRITHNRIIGFRSDGVVVWKAAKP